MKKITSKEVLYDYDYSADNLGIKVNRDFQYGETIEMEDGLLLDFDVNDVPTSLEILDASKRFNLPKDSLKNIVFLISFFIVSCSLFILFQIKSF